MSKPRLFLCNGFDPCGLNCDGVQRHPVSLWTLGAKTNVNIRLEDVAKVFTQHVSPRLEDLLEIAAFVYTGDCATVRDGKWQFGESVEPWSRDFHYGIAVRDPDFWSQEEIKSKLREILHFLSDDQYSFSFSSLTIDADKQPYFEFKDNDWPFYDARRVQMFSGGLDSLAGALETIQHGERPVLVSHRPVATQSKRQCDLFDALKIQYKQPMIHVPVWINKDEKKGREHTQRTRSFLYSALGTIVAASVRAGGVSFFENGVVSLNLPVADETIRARASRTTHPVVLQGFSDLYSLVLDRPFEVDNPFIFMTKTDIISLVSKYGGKDLIKLTCSCSHQGLFQSKTQWHCGSCSQCIDRRIAAIAAELEQEDPDADYVSNVFVGPRNDVYEKNMAVDYVRHATTLARMSDEEMAATFNHELSRAVRPFEKRSETAKKFIEMHRRHGECVDRVLERQLKDHAGELLRGSLEMTSLLAMTAGQQHQSTIWQNYARRIIQLLRSGLPRACKSEKPRNEPHLQEICDGILMAHDDQLVREFPFLRWGSTSTKPDWSAEQMQLWVELKYIRTKTDINPITEAIAADITKYGDNDRRVLYVIYDPSHLLIDEDAFAEPIVRRETMWVCFVR